TPGNPEARHASRRSSTLKRRTRQSLPKNEWVGIERVHGVGESRAGKVSASIIGRDGGVTTGCVVGQSRKISQRNRQRERAGAWSAITEVDATTDAPCRIAAGDVR